MIPTMVHGTKSTPRPRVEYFLTKEEKQKKERDLPFKLKWNMLTAYSILGEIQRKFSSHSKLKWNM